MLNNSQHYSRWYDAQTTDLKFAFGLYLYFVGYLMDRSEVVPEGALDRCAVGTHVAFVRTFSRVGPNVTIHFCFAWSPFATE